MGERMKEFIRSKRSVEEVKSLEAEVARLKGEVAELDTRLFTVRSKLIVETLRANKLAKELEQCRTKP